jgi:hypothetical protein
MDSGASLEIVPWDPNADLVAPEPNGDVGSLALVLSATSGMMRNR